MGLSRLLGLLVEACVAIGVVKHSLNVWAVGSEAMDGAIKVARQVCVVCVLFKFCHRLIYFDQFVLETGQQQRVNFIARELSFHGNTIGALSLGWYPARREPYAAILDDRHFHHVSPAYAARFKKLEETEEQYVERLRKELEDKFLELGPDTVIGCKWTLWFHGFPLPSILRGYSCCRDCSGRYHWLCSRT